jgi:hypothetical protein
MKMCPFSQLFLGNTKLMSPCTDSNDQDAFRVFVDRFSVPAPTNAFDMPNTMEAVALAEQVILERMNQIQAS